MKIILSVIILLTSICASAQTSQPITAEQGKAQFKAAIQAQFGISSVKADALITIISESGNKMIEVAKSKTISKAEKQAKFKSIAKDRDNQIAQQLTPEQINQLTDYLIQRRKLNDPKKQ